MADRIIEVVEGRTIVVSGEELLARLTARSEAAAESADEDAAAAAISAALAEAASLTAPQVYANTAAGLAAVAEGGTFWVKVGDRLVLYRDIAGVATEIASMSAFAGVFGSTETRDIDTNLAGEAVPADIGPVYIGVTAVSADGITVDSASNWPGGIAFRRNLGTPTSPTVVTSGTQLGYIDLRGFSGGQYWNAASIDAIVDPGIAFTDGNLPPARLRFATAVDNSGAKVRMEITPTGRVEIGAIDGVDYYGPAGAAEPKLFVNGRSNDWTCMVQASPASGASYGTRFDLPTSTTSDYFQSGFAAGSFRWGLNGRGWLALGKLAATSPLDVVSNVANDYAARISSAPSSGASAGLRLHTSGTATSDLLLGGFSGAGVGVLRFFIDAAGNIQTTGNLRLGGAVSGAGHVLQRVVAEGVEIGRLTNGSNYSAVIYAAAGPAANGAASTMAMSRDSTTSRSINASGTINASGADYAEYMVKADGCGPIAAGDVCGIDVDGKLTRSWADMIRPAVKSTAPNVVGADTWANPDAIGEKPEEPGFTAPVYNGPEAPDDAPDLLVKAPQPKDIPPEPDPFTDPKPVEPAREADEGDVAWLGRVQQYLADDRQWTELANARAAAISQHPALVERIESENAAKQASYDERVRLHNEALAARDAAMAEFEAAQAAFADEVEAAERAHQAAIDDYHVELAAWHERLEAARAGVDRIAYCGQVPVNFDGPFQSGDYLVAIANGGGIGLTAVTPAQMMADIASGGDLYLRRVGRILRRLDDGRPLIDVQHG